MIKLYRLYLLMIAIPIAIVGIFVSWLVYISNPTFIYIPLLLFFVPLGFTIIFVFYWIFKYYESIIYHLTSDEVVVERGVWWKMKHTVPYARIMSVDTVQGPISRKLGIATVDIYTAGYTGVSGGTGGLRSRRAEASIMHVSNFSEVREKVLSMVRGKPLFGARVSDLEAEMLLELRKIKELLEKKL